MTVFRLSACAIGLFLTLAGEVALAEPAPDATPRRARVLLPVCPELPFDREDLLATLRVELLAHGVELRHEEVTDDAEETALITVDSPSCLADDIHLRIDHFASGWSLFRRLDLGDRRAEERGRILALAVAELLSGRVAEELREPAESAAIAEGEEPPAAGETSTGAAVDESRLRREAVAATLRELDRRRRGARIDVRAVRLGAALVVRSYPIVQGGLFGAQAGVSVRLGQAVPLRLAVEVGYGYGGGTATLGDIRTQAALGGLALLLVSPTGRVRGVLGPRLELGWGWSEGRPSSAEIESRSVDGFLLTVALVGGMRVLLASRLWVTSEVHAGWVASSLEPRAEGRRVGGISRALLGLTVGLAVGL
jgi:hypothetical protein